MAMAIDAAQAAEWLDRELKGEYPDARGRFGPYGGAYVPIEEIWAKPK